MDQNSSGCPPIWPGYGVGMLPGNKSKGSVETNPVTDPKVCFHMRNDVWGSRPPVFRLCTGNKRGK